MQTRLFSGVDLANTILDGLNPVPGDTLCVLADPLAPGAMAYVDRISDYAARIALRIERLAYPTSDEEHARLPALLTGPVLLIQPAPDAFDASRFLDHIGPDADAEGLHPVHAGHHAKGEVAVIPPTAEAAAIVAAHLAGSLEGAVVSVVGASPTVGRPLAMALLTAGATVRVAQVTTKDLVAETCGADIVVAAAGVPGLIRCDHLRRGAIAIDIGVTRVGNRLVGDIDRAAVDGHVSWLTHVPDGVGPVTTACLLRNAVNACRKMNSYSVST
ncbi:bifunctional 5,10-methylenetetrahydrofolate dehydrogenase/5,10-methenyltetrahydrofolate cyclohydrolase [Rhodophyticola sp. CCM32]|uniref:bifunctional 5,10-methylenetetrahydrofolate dehydrogenase/5,10-methenyltetrahydrofolate cyclohydrolase n=1 Tax=Rhodophyticola sp. CCM32 TaxID=2916397 RepID=UPI00107EF013|nr:bifunctional 5,10-methylenetetrahydrofolate dehydrogenase/5,10-methenyltetrahydrofolate cyclohydrolase [Rhodophyticola sp. CCM32]QBY01318.1 bifunctional 5,10-methylenetetrahydrofolate dehydrogenase/5,10-methenyltetrahydrofolate cyclohydrolase [Rhodophyticola sp. CCM32]